MIADSSRALPNALTPAHNCQIEGGHDSLHTESLVWYRSERQKLILKGGSRGYGGKLKSGELRLCHTQYYKVCQILS